MQLFLSTLSQMAYLFTLILVGYVLMKRRAVPDNAVSVLSKVESNFLIPAMILDTFLEKFNTKTLSETWGLFFCSFAVLAVLIPFCLFVCRRVTKDRYLQNIYTFGLAFANYAFMGYAVVKTLFPELFFEYVIFTLPIWIAVYLWGTPCLLIGKEKDGKKGSFWKNLCNPMVVCMLLGILLGLVQLPVPQWLRSVLSHSGACMSPLAMVLTGMILPGVSLKKTFASKEVYLLSLIKLILMPLAFVAVGKLFSFERSFFICALCTIAMPLGVTSIVIPASYDKDTSQAAGLVLVTHLFSCITLPFIFSLI